MACLKGDADLALCLEAANAGTVAGAWIDDDEGPLLASICTPFGGVTRANT
jgi:hypothetical protein